MRGKINAEDKTQTMLGSKANQFKRCIKRMLGVKILLLMTQLPRLTPSPELPVKRLCHVKVSKSVPQNFSSEELLIDI